MEFLDIAGGERVLEIGCGWGALMERLTPHCDVTGITLSAEQLAFTRKRLPARRRRSRLQDYRDVNETFDRIVSIEMIEAVGERYWPVYFAKLKSALKTMARCCCRRSRSTRHALTNTGSSRISSSAIFFRAACCRPSILFAARPRARDWNWWRTRHSV